MATPCGLGWKIWFSFDITLYHTSIKLLERHSGQPVRTLLANIPVVTVLRKLNKKRICYMKVSNWQRETQLVRWFQIVRLSEEEIRKGRTRWGKYEDMGGRDKDSAARSHIPTKRGSPTSSQHHYIYSDYTALSSPRNDQEVKGKGTSILVRTTTTQPLATRLLSDTIYIIPQHINS